MKQKKLDHLDLVCLEIAKYNKIHNTYYSYGEYTALVRAGKIISDVVSEKRCKKNENEKVMTFARTAELRELSKHRENTQY